jgi:hypothetical protein
MKALQPLTPNVPLRDRLVLFAKDTRERAAGLPPGNERDELIRKARQADTAHERMAALFLAPAAEITSARGRLWRPS